ncbi:receptor-like protein 7 [Salvia hispanica]|uniref:receptor-like protein 7 n=1 Tax=Salvia hispanica TaxID=49212 RepID=UPI002009855D|nr:receptor-like protein 7 [Salvia hispanica]
MTVSSLLFFLVFFFLVVFLNGQCLDDQKKLLLELKSSSSPLSLMSWNATHDCCEWAGVKCDDSGHVIVLDLFKDDICGRISDSSTLFNLTYLSQRLHHNGQIEDSPIANNSTLLFLDLSSIRIEGHVPNFFFQFRSMIILELSTNFFSAVFELDRIPSLANLSEIILSNNNLSVDTSTASPTSYGYPRIYTFQMSSCNLYDFPDLRNLSLSELDLSNNYIGGDIPSWIWEMELVSLNLSLNLLTDFQKPYHISYSINTIDLHSNRLRCELPLLSEAFEFGYAYLFLANSSLTGAIPTSICIRSRRLLDLSFNNLTGSIP